MTKVSLLKYQQDDFEIYKQLVGSDEVMKYISGKGLSEKKAREKFRSILDINSQEPALGTFKIFHEAHGFIGDGKIEMYTHQRNMLEIGYILKKEFWGFGYGTAICAELLRIADQFDSALNIIGIIDPENIASRTLLEKFGFVSIYVGVEDVLPTEKLILIKDHIIPDYFLSPKVAPQLKIIAQGAFTFLL